MPNVSFPTIGTIHSCFKEKFGIPRQSGLVLQAESVLKFVADPYFREALRGVEEFTHIWVISVFHEGASHSHKKPSVRPPRLGGQKRMGVFATRSPHRFNPIGLSVGEVVGIDWDAPGGIELKLRGLDLLEGTPVLDIKPYLSYADSIPHASGGWVEELPTGSSGTSLEVTFSNEAEEFLKSLSGGPRFRALMVDLLKLDPRPGFQRKLDGIRYGMRIDALNFRWEVRPGGFHVFEISFWSQDSQSES